MIDVNFLWHMHQPDYRPAGSREPILPWVRLHAVRGYLDLLAVLERFPAMHCTVNFSGILLEQLLSYSAQDRDYFAALSLRRADDLSPDEAAFVLEHFFSANVKTLIRPSERYWQLHQKRESLRKLPQAEQVAQFSAQELIDLLVWFNLAWIGFTGRKLPEVRTLFERGRDFGHADQQAVLGIHERLLAEVLPRYAALQDAGSIELALTPYQHPILPLLHDCRLGHHNPVDPLPQFSWPDDAAEQVRLGIQWYERAFGNSPRGAWPAEGSISDAALGTLANAGLRWAASDQQNIPAEGRGRLPHLSPWSWQHGGHELLLLFRDTRLSDNIGFDYATWDPQDAATHLSRTIAALGDESQFGQPVVSVILDGENPWEAFPDGGEGFLSALFGAVTADERLDPVTPSMLLERGGWPTLPHVKPGSWIMGNFDIWTRDHEARVAWRRLARTREDVAGSMSHEAVREQILAAEGSDWFWWFGDTFQSDQKPQFDELFRSHLIAAYEAAELTIPDEMFLSIIAHRAAPRLQTEVTELISPVLDGRVSSYFEWRGAIEVDPGVGQGAMAVSSTGGYERVLFGFSPTHFYLRIELTGQLLAKLSEGRPRLRISFTQNSTEQLIRFTARPGRRRSRYGRIAVDRLIEVESPLDQLRLESDAPAYFSVEIVCGPQAHRFPASGRVEFAVPPEDFELRSWIV